MRRRRLTGTLLDPDPPLRHFIHSGAAILDCVLGGGWACGRIVNVVGDRSAGKTLLAIEACANFSRQFPGCPIWYNEVEAAFDESYARQLGIPVDKIHFVGKNDPEQKCFTVEDFYEDLCRRIDEVKGKEQGFYLLDSLDALSDEAERSRDIRKGSFGASKAAQMSELFRRINQDIAGAGITVMIISQLRDKIGVTFGEKKTRSGGHSLDFYASQILWLAHLGRIVKTVSGVKRAVGVKVKAQCKKNKIAPPFRECDLPILFGYGVDDLTANIDWLKEITQAPDPKSVTRDEVAQMVVQAWKELEEQFEPNSKKYGEV